MAHERCWRTFSCDTEQRKKKLGNEASLVVCAALTTSIYCGCISYFLVSASIHTDVHTSLISAEMSEKETR